MTSGQHVNYNGGDSETDFSTAPKCWASWVELISLWVEMDDPDAEFGQKIELHIDHVEDRLERHIWLESLR